MEIGETMLSELCRICLDSNCKLYSMKMYELDQTFEVISGIKLYEDHTLPVKACAICILLLKKCKLLSHDIHRAQEVLQQFMQKDDELNSRHLYHKLLLDKRSKHNLTHQPYPPNHFDFIYEHTEIKLIEINESQLEKDINNEIKEEPDSLGINLDEKIEENNLNDSLLLKNIDFESENSSNQEAILSDADSDSIPIYELIKTKKKRKLKKKPKLQKSLNTKSKEVEPKIDRRRKPFMNTELNVSSFTLIELSFEEQLQEIYKRKECSNYINAVYKCENCYKGFLDEEAYKGHMKKHSLESGTYVCDVCKIHFRLRHSLRKHITAHHSTRYKCNMCPYVSTHRQAARLHEKWHVGTKYECTYCTEVFDKYTTYMGHLRIKHPSDFVCQLCGYSFVSEKGIHLHKKLKHLNVSMDIPENAPSCELCGIQFVSVEAFEKHLQVSNRHQEDKERKLPNTNSRKTRKMQDRDRPTVRKRQKMSIEGDDSNYGQNKKSEGPISCEQCGMQMEDPRAYHAHFRKMHPDKNRTNYPSMKTPCMCELCGRIFQSFSLLKDHRWVHTGEKPFKCDMCPKSFRMKQRLVTHRHVHSTQRTSYECNVCGKHFSTPSNRQRHMSIHTGLKPFKCEMCSKSFKHMSEKRSHIKYVHLKKPWPKRSRQKQRMDTKTDNIGLVGMNEGQNLHMSWQCTNDSGISYVI